MPIVSTVFIRPIEQQKFAELDCQVTPDRFCDSRKPMKQTRQKDGDKK
jgi:hypothetical protein